MLAIQVILSIMSMVTQNCVSNNVCKKELKTNEHIYMFNTIAYLMCVIFLGVSLINSSISVYTVILALLFGVVTALGTMYKMMSLSVGPMYITLLITTSSTIIPTMSGVFFGEKFSLNKLIAVIILIGFIYLSFEKSGDTKKINKKWFFYSSLAFLFQGSIGVLQKVHQSSPYKDESNVFLFVAFICSLVYSRLRAKKPFKEFKFTKKYILLAVVCGICTYAMNALNLKLSGIIPSQLFFPVVNGSTIVLSSLMSVIFFKEQLTKKQLVGLCGGIASLIVICLVK